ncbi:chemotaxis-specific protein-glutamate methyltransferase CheB [Natrialbaceae archaeon AArc-T1-2]|uniref:chemotaxis-specific protein-glutamate methyltransferase CheB n=1 Tax=Natrialbaceae archaeon AArc-T1-2 TaxID=3053904 RepID=UPI00255AB3D4|nr:chemotaxis-specific protein-glutamate methyltransferase CheB [Natrialbaceae archaeon AArc-T1-2]WIV67931.1 chemotaxis-specific protein-glutamate methyltransferase CheB [Natrialbaceae archaeon AArc-T1-2]
MTSVLVVDDSRFMRTVVGNALERAGYEVSLASNGLEAVDRVRTDRPDVVTMDVEMPELGGIEAVERIMSTYPTPILMLSAYTDDGADATLDALERGAADFLPKPDGSSRTVVDLTAEVTEKVDELAATDVSSLALARAAAAIESIELGSNGRDLEAAAGPTAAVDAGSVPASASASGSDAIDTGDGTAVDSSDAGEEVVGDDPLVVVGASTGGPKIVEQLLATLPRELGAKLLVVQHMPPAFTGRLADRLDRISEYRVREARDGDRIGPGDALVAPGGYHLEVVDGTGGRVQVGLDESEPRHGVKPAIDVTMETAATRAGDPLVGVVLTGMGRDGAAGIEAIKAAGGRTIAQDEQTSPVFGIPCQAIETGCVDDVVPAGAIADSIVSACGENHE